MKSTQVLQPHFPLTGILYWNEHRIGDGAWSEDSCLTGLQAPNTTTGEGPRWEACVFSPAKRRRRGFFMTVEEYDRKFLLSLEVGSYVGCYVGW